MSDLCVAITGTVVPNVLMHGHDTLDPATRRREYEDVGARRRRYLETLSMYAATLDAPIFFLENSSYDFSNDADFQNLLQANRIVLVKFPPSRRVERGKGFQEFEMIDVFVKSVSTRYRAFLKVSGRYQYQNVASLVDAHTDGLLIDLHKRLRVAVTSLFVATIEFYERHVMALYHEADDRRGAWIERVLYSKLQDSAIRRTVQLLPVEPQLTDPSQIGEGQARAAIRKLKYPLKDLERAILRRLGIKELYP